MVKVFFQLSILIVFSKGLKAQEYTYNKDSVFGNYRSFCNYFHFKNKIHIDSTYSKIDTVYFHATDNFRFKCLLYFNNGKKIKSICYKSYNSTKSIVNHYNKMNVIKEFDKGNNLISLETNTFNKIVIQEFSEKGNLEQTSIFDKNTKFIITKSYNNKGICNYQEKTISHSDSIDVNDQKEIKYFHPTGELATIIIQMAGLQEMKIWYKNGILKEVGNILNTQDLKIGLWKEYYNSGKIKREYFFDNEGEKSGKWIDYLEDGTIFKVKSYN